MRSLSVPLRASDLVYHNNFRIFLVFENSEPERLKISRYVYFPKLDFVLQQIS
jgi:hypothetical protein